MCVLVVFFIKTASLFISSFFFFFFGMEDKRFDTVAEGSGVKAEVILEKGVDVVESLVLGEGHATFHALLEVDDQIGTALEHTVLAVILDVPLFIGDQLLELLLHQPLFFRWKR